jgi:RNA polymerase sigma-70 factor (ECF subfamily)
MISTQTRSGLPEAAQIQLILDGNAEEFCGLMRPHQRVLYLKALSIVGSEADAEEVVQNAVLKAFNKLSTFRHESQFRTWLMSITINEARMWLRNSRASRHESLEQEDEEGHRLTLDIADPGESPYQALERKQLRTAILKALSRLPSCNSQVFILRDLQLLSIAETAKALGVTETCVKTRLRRGRIQMRQALARLYTAETVEPSHSARSSAEGWRDSVPGLASTEQISESVSESIQ